jgi:hypothetical protein
MNSFGQTFTKVNNEVYDEVGEVGWDLSTVSKNNKWGIINNKGKEILPIEYENIGQITSNQNAVNVKNNGFWGIFNFTTKQYIVPCEYDTEVFLMNFNSIGLSKNKKWAIYNYIEKKYITDYIYSYFLYEESLTLYGYGYRDGKRYEINKDGSEKSIGMYEGYILDDDGFQLETHYIKDYDSAKKIPNKMLWIVKKNEKMGVRDEK